MVAPRDDSDQPRILTQDPLRIVAKRLDQGLDQQSLARLAGLGKTTLWQIEHGRRSATPDTLTKIATALSCEIRDIMSPQLRSSIGDAPTPKAVA